MTKNEHEAAVDEFIHKAREIMAHVTHKCPKCGEPLKVKHKTYVTIEQPKTNGKVKRDPGELMNIEQFLAEWRKSSRQDMVIIAEYADTVRKIRGWSGHTTVGEWRVFTKINLKAANDLLPTWNTEEGKRKIGLVIEKIKANANGYLKEFRLATIVSELEKV